MKRFLVKRENIREGWVTIDDPREVHHLRDVLRLAVGARVVCFDGEGAEYVGTIDRETQEQLSVRIDRQKQKVEQEGAIWLAQGLPKGDRFDWVVQKATELGVSRLVPLVSGRTIVRLTVEGGRKKRARWQRIAEEAAKQSGRSTVPVVETPQAFDEVLPRIQESALTLIPTLTVRGEGLQAVLGGERGRGSLGVLIGPEGDFTREEVRLAQAGGARAVSLGPFTLRSETAAVATLAILQYALGRASGGRARLLNETGTVDTPGIGRDDMEENRGQ